MKGIMKKKSVLCFLMILTFLITLINAPVPISAAVDEFIDDKTEKSKLLELVSDSRSPVINPNGSVTFNYKDDFASSVALRGSMNNWGETPMIKDSNGVWSVNLRLGDNASNYEYKFFVNNSVWNTDPLNNNYSNGNSLLIFPQYGGRKVVIAGTIQSVAGESNWNPASEKTSMSYIGNGIYEYTFNNVPAGSYEYKVAMGSWDPENYGADGVSYGANIQITVPETRKVTFKYNDDTHRIVDSVNYKFVNAYLTGDPLTQEVKLVDAGLTGIYKAAVELDKGIYSDLKIVIKDEARTIQVPEINVDKKGLITIFFEPVTQTVFNDISSQKIKLESIIYDSRDGQYKKPFGAVKTNTKTSFSIKTGNEVAVVKMVLFGPKGTRIHNMTKVAGKDSSCFSIDLTFDTAGTYSYYFLLSNGSDAAAYGDDSNADLGLGKAGPLGTVKKYTINVYSEDFKTPEWLKKAVVYQIFPDRFFNGDKSNDYLQKLARGYDPYEFYSNWYSIPENPGLEAANMDEYVKNGGTVGDMIWTNEMYGGDIAGIKEKLDYLQALGVTVLYLNPISASVSNHRYDTTNYKELDRLLGSPEEFKELAQELKRRDMHLIIDGVYNHVSDDSVYFDRYRKYMSHGKPLGAYQYWKYVYDSMKNGVTQADAEKSAVDYFKNFGITDLHYKDWFDIKNEWISKDADGSILPESKQHYKYEGWWGFDSLPVIKALNGSELNIKTWKDEIVKENTQYWLELGANGYRLDVPNEVSDETWSFFRDVVKAAGDNVIIGEIWADASQYLSGDMYDSVMNYRFRETLLNYLRDGVSGNDVQNQLELIREQYPKEAYEAMLNLVDSHDTERILCALDGMIKDKNDNKLAPAPTEKARKLQKLVPLIQMTYPGAPTIYYGDELGMIGARDPDCRRGMIWGRGDKDTLAAYAAYANIRSNYPVLQTGDVSPIYMANKDILAYERYDADNNAALTVVNRGSAYLGNLKVPVKYIPNGTVLKDAVNGTQYTVIDSMVEVNLHEAAGMVLVTGYKELNINIDLLKDGYDPAYIVKDRVVPAAIDEVACDQKK